MKDILYNISQPLEVNFLGRFEKKICENWKMLELPIATNKKRHKLQDDKRDRKRNSVKEVAANVDVIVLQIGGTRNSGASLSSNMFI